MPPLRRIAPFFLAAVLCGLGACTPLGGGQSAAGSGGGGVTVFGDIDAGVTRAR